MFLGFSVAVISIHGSQKNIAAVAVLGPLLIMGYPILDTGLVILRRLNAVRVDSSGRGGVRYMARNAHRVFLPDRGHLHHRLIDAGMSHRGAVLLLYGCGLATAVAALVLVVSNSPAVAVLLATSLIAMTSAFFAYVVYRTRRDRRRRGPEVGAAPRVGTPTVTSDGALGRH